MRQNRLSFSVSDFLWTTWTKIEQNGVFVWYKSTSSSVAYTPFIPFEKSILLHVWIALPLPMFAAKWMPEKLFAFLLFACSEFSHISKLIGEFVVSLAAKKKKMPKRNEADKITFDIGCAVQRIGFTRTDIIVFFFQLSQCVLGHILVFELECKSPRKDEIKRIKVPICDCASLRKSALRKIENETMRDHENIYLNINTNM